MSSFDLSGKVAIITGASLGIGKGFALGLAKAGADVVLAARTPEPLEAACNEVRALGRKALSVPTDVTVAGQVEQLVRSAKEEFGHIDILVNNAGGNPGRTFKRAPLLELTEHDFDECMALNVKSAFLCSKAVVPIMMEQQSGVIINVSSSAGQDSEAPRTGFSAYGAAKAAVLRLTVCMAAEWGPQVRVNCIIPGFIDNPKPTPGRTPKALAIRVQSIAAGRIGQPEDVAAAAVYLCSDAANWVTGASIDVHGGIKSSGPSALPASGQGILRT